MGRRHASINRHFRLIWNAVRGTWIAVHERSRGRSKGGSSGRGGSILVAAPRCLAAALALGFAGAAVAQAGPPAVTLPQGGTVVAGQASIQQAGAALTIQQASARAAIDWQSFNLGAGASVSFRQPDASSVTLNRVLDGNPSQIFGRISSNGQVFLSNPAGIYFSPTARVDVGGLTATTHRIGTAEFMAGASTFSRDGASGSVVNAGELTARLGGYIALLAPEVRNEGVLLAQAGTVALAAGEVIELQFAGQQLTRLRVQPSALAALVDNRHAVLAPGGVVLMSAQAAQELQGGVIKNSGNVSASSLTERGGRILLEAGSVFHGGTLAASGHTQGGSVRVNAAQVALLDGVVKAEGQTGGQVSVNADRLGQSALVSVDGTQAGGQIALQAQQVQQTQGTTLSTRSEHGQGGQITLEGGAHNSSLFSSATLDATGATGGRVQLTADRIDLYAAHINASGRQQGGQVLIGGDFQGKNPAALNAQNTTLNAFTTVKADATQQGDGGRVIVWSDKHTAFSGNISAQGGEVGGNGGFIEVSGKETLAFNGTATAAAPRGQRGTLLLDPKNLTIDGSVSEGAVYTLLANPNPLANSQHGNSGVTELTNGNLVVTSGSDDFAATNAGAAFLYSGSTGALIAALRGSTAEDQVGNAGATALTNGNYVVRSTAWINSGATSAGAVTWGHGSTGISGVVSAINSLVGSTSNDAVGSGGITALINGSYVVSSPNWDNGVNTNAGAVTWGHGDTGVSGAVSSGNSLVGSRSNDSVGSGGITALSSGGIAAMSNPNYVVRSLDWANGIYTTAGAVTWGSGTSGISGAVSASNSLVGSYFNDQVGLGGITVLTSGNYVVNSHSWDNGTPNFGAVTWGSGTTGVRGVVSASNSLVGSARDHSVGSGGVTALSNGHYVVASPTWDNVAVANVGAVTWANGSTGRIGAVSTVNSLVGSTTNDQVGVSVTALTNGNYVVRSSSWNNSGAARAGAVTWGNGSTGTIGTVSSINSLVGSRADDQVGSNGVTALSNGNYVVNSIAWSNGSTEPWAGAVTWGSGTAGVSGVVSATNSLVGVRGSDNVGGGGITALSNGNYVVNSPSWRNGVISWAGAVTWGDGNTGIRGLISASNSLVGGTSNERVGFGGVTALANGSYVVGSPLWDNGGIADAGAVTWGSGTAGIIGVISTGNSLVGTRASEQLGAAGVTALSSGNYLVSNSNWNSPSAGNAGSVTWGSGTAGVSGVISASNSLVGSQSGDQVGLWGLTALNNGNYVVLSRSRYNGSLHSAGAVTWGNGAVGVTGEVTASNSLLGVATGDFSSSVITPLSNGWFAVRAPNFNQGGLVDSGAVWRAGPGADAPVSATFASNPGANSSITPASIKAVLDTGTNVVLQANNDITLASALVANNPSGNGGALTLQAGRSIHFNANLSTDNGNLTAIANDPGALSAHRDAGVGTITIASGVTIDVGTGTAVLAGQRFVNNSGAGAMATSGAGRWQVWSGNPADDVRGGLVAGFKQYNATYGSSSVLGSGNGLLYTLAPTITASLTGSVQRDYDATTGATLLAGHYSHSGAVDGDSVLLNNPGSGSFDTKHVGTGKTVTATGVAVASASNGATPVFGYQMASSTASGTIGRIDAVPLTVGGLSANHKVYDATTAAGLSGTASVTALGSDVVTVSGGVGSFADKHVGTGKAVTVSGLVLGGTDAGNYTLVAPTGLAANITPASLAVGGLSANHKVYDATMAAGLSGTASVTALASDVVTVSGGSGSFADKNVGTAKAVTVSGLTLGGADAGNYTLVAPAGLTANITTAGLAVSGLSANHKVYDATTAAGLSGTASVAPLGSDVVTVSGGNANFADKNVGTAKAVTVSGLVLGGTDAGNYTLVAPAGLTANITPAGLAVSGLSANHKVYDATTTAALAGTASVTALASDVVTVSGGTGSFADKNVGTAKAVTVSGLTLGGADAGNYTLVAPTGLIANITPAALAVGGLSANHKVYDATTTAALAGTASVTALASDVVAVSGGTGSFADKNVGTAKAVTVSGLTLGGADAGNYTLVAPTGLTANITPAALAVGGLSANHKVYDATTAAGLSGTASVTALGSDVVTVSGGNANFADKNVGTGKVVSVSGLALGGTDAGNYTLVAPVGLIANITPALLAVSGLSANDKVYDATAAASLSGTASVVALGSDVVTVSGGTGSFADKNVGTAKAVTVSGLTLGGTDAGNYTLVAPTGLIANITPAALAVGGLSANHKVYDATTSAALAGTASVTALAGDVVTVSGGLASFVDKNVGTGKAVTVSGLALGGADASNYTLVAPTGLAANITPALLAVSGLSANHKVYDATTAAGLSGTASVTPLASDVVTVSGGNANFADKNVGTAKAVTVNGLTLGGVDAGNYTLVAPTGLTAHITPAALAVGGLSANHKVYDATTAASLSGTASVTALAGDVVTVSGGSASFADKNVGTAKAVSVSGLVLGGADAGNYTLVAPTGLTATITPAALAVRGLSASSKVYDATTTAALVGTASVTAMGSDVLTVSGGSASFADKNVGTGKAVSVNGLVLGGADAGNYTLGAPTGLTANIAPAVLAVSGLSANHKVYDASAAATLSGSARVTPLASDAVTVSGGSASFADKNVGTGKAVTVSGLVLGGADAGNYTLVAPAGLTAHITPAALAVSGLSANDKVYDATTAASLRGTASVTPLASDVVTVNGGAGSFADKNVGSGKAVTVNGLALAGADAGNYTLVAPTGLTASITPAALAVGGLSANDKVYDASTAASLGGTASVMPLRGDAVDLAGFATGRFADGNVGAGIGVAVSGLSLTGADAANYAIVLPATLSASITPASLLYVADAKRFSSGGPLPALTGSVRGLVGGEDLATATRGQLLFSTSALSGALPGSYAITGGGLSARNYVLTQAPGNATALTVVPPAVSVVAPQVPPAALPEPPAAPPVPGLRQASSAPALIVTAQPQSGAAGGLFLQRELAVEMTPAAGSSGDRAAVVRVSVPAELVRSGGSFSFEMPAEVMRAVRASGATPRIALASGGAWPAWLVADVQAGRFVASSVPADGLPLGVVVSVAGFTATLEIAVSGE